MKRYALTLDLYLFANNDREALEKAMEVIKELKAKEDNHAALIELVEAPFGKIETRKVK